MATVNEKMTAIADAIRAKTGESSDVKYGLDAMAAAIAALETGGGAELPEFLEEINFGTFRYNEATYNVEVAHGLSDKPKGFVLWLDDASKIPNSKYIDAAYGFSHKYYNPASGGTFYGNTWFMTGGSGTSVGSFTANATVFKLYSSSFNVPVHSNTDYYWASWR